MFGRPNSLCPQPLGTIARSACGSFKSLPRWRFGLACGALIAAVVAAAWLRAETARVPAGLPQLESGRFYAVDVSRPGCSFDLAIDRCSRYEVIVSSLGDARQTHRVNLQAIPLVRLEAFPAVALTPLKGSAAHGNAGTRGAPGRLDPREAPAVAASCQLASCGQAGSLPLRSRRRFFLHVTTDALEDERGYVPVAGVLAGEGKRVRVYLDRDVPESNLAPGLIDEIIRLFDEEIIPRSRELLGDHADVDHDGKLAVLVTPWLGRLCGGRTSLKGFVRANDFQAEIAAPFGNHADLVYLNSSVEPGKTLKTLLAHEYTHAVCFSRRLAVASPASALPPEEDWLNEAIAHVAENLHATGNGGSGCQIWTSRPTQVQSDLPSRIAQLNKSERRLVEPGLADRRLPGGPAKFAVGGSRLLSRGIVARSRLSRSDLSVPAVLCRSVWRSVASRSGREPGRWETQSGTGHRHRVSGAVPPLDNRCGPGRFHFASAARKNRRLRSERRGTHRMESRREAVRDRPLRNLDVTCRLETFGGTASLANRRPRRSGGAITNDSRSSSAMRQGGSHERPSTGFGRNQIEINPTDGWAIPRITTDDESSVPSVCSCSIVFSFSSEFVSSSPRIILCALCVSVVQNACPARERSGIHANKPSMVRERLNFAWIPKPSESSLFSRGRACAVLAMYVGSSSAVAVVVTIRSTTRSTGLSVRQLLEQHAERRHFLTQQIEPRLWVPDFDTDGSPDEHHFALAGHVQKFAKSFGDDQPRSVGQPHCSRAGRQQPPQALHVSPFLLHPSRLNLLPDQIDAVVRPLLPVGGTPETETTGPLLRENHVPFGIGDRLGQLGRQRDPVTVINDPLEFARQK